MCSRTKNLWIRAVFQTDCFYVYGFIYITKSFLYPWPVFKQHQPETIE